MIPLSNGQLLGSDQYQFILYDTYPKSKPKPKTFHPRLDQVARKLLHDELFKSAKEAESFNELKMLFDEATQTITSQLQCLIHKEQQ